MPWFRVDDNLAFHKKAMIAGNEAIGLWARAGSWAMGNLTDGHVPDGIVQAMLGSDLAERLVDAGLWHRVDDGYQFHEWGERQPTAEQIIADREKARVRKERQRSSGRSHGVTPAEPTPGVRLPQSQSQSHTHMTSSKTSLSGPVGDREPLADSTDYNLDVHSLLKNLLLNTGEEWSEEEALAWAEFVLGKAQKRVKNPDGYLTRAAAHDYGNEVQEWLLKHRSQAK